MSLHLLIKECRNSILARRLRILLAIQLTIVHFEEAPRQSISKCLLSTLRLPVQQAISDNHSIFKSLLDAGFIVTALFRPGGNASALIHTQSLHQSSRRSHLRLTPLQPALLGIDVIISCVATLAIGSQKPLIDALVAAGVRRFIQAEFGMDSANGL
ncbi:isoflavone reductase [Colletotrichum paranaense]|uniref:Isoflavone reductase n=1 Tax=Colletotrichum paranaense TaxID=1914294 RepID=A0ABQ9S9L8_9PEZI|nr:isoflavone reductase [Colletotrichum paranaense]KAK1529975.1 isoflavone reductase [Colletotrichum paranaense]